jgi:hypothetical protein
MSALEIEDRSSELRDNLPILVEQGEESRRVMPQQ